MSTIKFSVIIPLYNKESSILSTIESILNQSYANFELLIVNDGSTDGSLEVVQSINDSRIKIINKPNGGVSSARNLGIEKAQNQYIVFLDADDFWYPFCLEEFRLLITEFPGAEVFCTNYNMTGMNLTGSDKRYLVEDFYYTSAYFLAKWTIPIMLTGCVSIKNTLFQEVGNFNQNISHGEDIDMWERLAQKYTLAKSEKVTTIYRTETENRASLLDESAKQYGNDLLVSRRDISSKSQKLYLGVQFLFDLKEFLGSGKNFSKVRKEIINLDWMIRGMFFLIKVRFLKIAVSHANNKSL